MDTGRLLAGPRDAPDRADRGGVGGAAVLNIAWPRVAFEQRYLDWSVWIGVAVLGVLGALLLAGVRSRILASEVIDDAEVRDELADTHE